MTGPAPDTPAEQPVVGIWHPSPYDSFAPPPWSPPTGLYRPPLHPVVVALLQLLLSCLTLVAALPGQRLRT